MFWLDGLECVGGPTIHGGQEGGLGFGAGNRRCQCRCSTGEMLFSFPRQQSLSVDHIFDI